MKVYIEKCHEDAVIPSYAKSGDAGMDVYAIEDVILMPGETDIVPIGIKVAIPDGYELQVRPRSGLSLKTSLRVANAPGTIDSGYRDEICVIMTNISDENLAIIKKGDRIAQFVLQQVPRVEWEEVNSVSKIGEDRGGGFGSTGK